MLKERERDIEPEKETTKVQAGMGSIPSPRGTTFRVWAPFADEVYVTGSFNDWSDTANPLDPEGDGYWAAHVSKANAGDEYKYVIVNGDQTLQRDDPYARELTNSAGNSIIVDPAFDWGDDDFQMPNWNELVIYEIHVGTFNDHNEDGPGDFRSVIDKLSYLQDLGINVIELMPPMEFPGGFSWGYNPAYPFALESDYGGPKAFKELVKAAHAHEIAVILDVVYNHLGPGDLDLWQFDGWSENGGGGIYFYNDWRADTPWGHTRPDYGREEVRRYIRDNALMWLDEYRVDGLRFDGTFMIRNAQGNESSPAADLPDGWGMMQWINDEIKTRYPAKITFAEDFRNNAWITKPTSEGGAGFDSQWDGSFVHPVRQALIANDDAFRDVGAVAQALTHRFDGDPIKRVIYTESHDEVANGRARVPEEIWPGHADSWFSKKRSMLGAALVLTAPGIPLLFQGQEFLEDAWFRDKVPLDWERAERFNGIHNFYKQLMRLRRNLDGHSLGLTGPHIDVHHLNNEAKVLGYHRWQDSGPQDSVLVVINMTNQSYDDYTIGFPHEGTWRLRLNSDSTLYDPEFSDYSAGNVTATDGERDGMPHHASLRLGPYSILIFSQNS